ncbi:hypothetical protein JTB14_016738 [Gonioctena quinquepunctata]|nr:hypothetical protein JTB14_016738 [Gonioctena quinquepunctata]
MLFGVIFSATGTQKKPCLTAKHLLCENLSEFFCGINFGTFQNHKMAKFNNTTSYFYDFLFTELVDPRTNTWFMISDPALPLTIIILYLLFVLKWGPEMMKNRKPYEFRHILILYNFSQVLLSLWFFVESLDGAWFLKYSWICEPVDFSYSPQALRAQFALIFLHTSQLFFVDCGYPKVSMFFVLPNALMFCYMFTDFYQRVYGREKTVENQITTH